MYFTHQLPFTASSTTREQKRSGRKNCAISATATVAKIVEMYSWMDRLRSTWRSCVTFSPGTEVAKNEVRKDDRMPPADTSSGNIMKPQFLFSSSEVDATTSAAHVDSAKDPNRSAPIPATSPTLSPTLSAITAGLRGSSSGMPTSTLPTRSAPTSAAFV